MTQTAAKEVLESEKVEETCFDRETDPKSSSHVTVVVHLLSPPRNICLGVTSVNFGTV